MKNNMEKTIYELCDEFNVRLCFFDHPDIEDDGYFDTEHQIVFVRKGLPEHVQKQIVLHELGHRNHSPLLYSINPIKHENEADRFMIRNLLKDYISEYGPDHFNWLRFAKAYNLTTTTNETVIKEEFGKMV